MTTETATPPTAAAPPAEPAPPTGSGRGWRAALRIARRTVRRNLGRSALVATLVGVPVAGATLVDVLYRTFGTPERYAYQLMADGDALMEVTSAFTMPDDYFPSPNAGWDLPDEREPAEVDVRSMLPDGTNVVPAPSTYSSRVEHGDGTTDATVVAAELGHQLTQNRVRLASGDWPDGPDEVLINLALGERLGLLDGDDVAAGATVTLNDGPTLNVTGVGLDPFQTDNAPWNQLIFAPSESAAVEFLDEQGVSGRDWRTAQNGGIAYIVTLPDGSDVDALWPALAAQGVAMTPREAVLDPQRYESSTRTSVPVDTSMVAAAGLVALIVGLGLLEVVLLAGAAFAVTARRQVRDLGLVTANGGTSQHVRRIMYAQGLVLGTLGSLLGLAVGAALALAGKPLWERLSGSLIERWHFGAAELAIAAGVGVLSGLAAAFVPARGAARMRPIDALAQRFRATPLTARLPRAGLVLVALGVSGSLVASRVAAAELEEYAAALAAAEGSGQWIPSPPVTQPFIAVQLLGSVVAVAGLILMITFLITVMARRMRHWPLSARYAARDAARHRHRTTPAVAAIMIVVASAAGLSIGFAGADRVDELRYQPILPDNVMRVDINGADGQGFESSLEVVAAALPSAQVVLHSAPGSEVNDGISTWFDRPVVFTPDPWEAWAEENCAIVGDGGYECGDQDLVYDYDTPVQEQAELAIATPELMELAYDEPPDGATLAALEAGAVIIPGADFADADGTVTFEIYDWESDGRGGGTGEIVAEVVLPTHVVEVDGPGFVSVPRAFISEATAAQHWDIHSAAGLIRFADSATADELDEARDVAESLGYSTYVEQGPPSRQIVQLILAAGAGFVVLVGVGVTVALAAAEGRADLATMAAVGASPRSRRAIAGWQALVVGGLGTALGIVLGGFFAYLIWPAIGAPEFIVPWQTLGLIAIAVPLLAALVAIAFTPSRLPMIRRAT